MASTASLGPLSNTTVAGKTSWGQPVRVHRDQTSSSAAFTTSANVATLWYNCFDSGQIPAGATIDGIELVSETIATGTGRIGTAGSTGVGETATMSIRLYNGTSYSSSLYSNTFSGANDYYPDPSGSGQVLVGGPTNLVGLTWDPADQADFGFRIDVDSITDTPVMVALRGLTLKVYYTEGGTSPTPTPSLTPTPTPTPAETFLVETINSVLPNTINKLGGIIFSSMTRFNGVLLKQPTSGTETVYLSVDFSDQTYTNTTTFPSGWAKLSSLTDVPYDGTTMTSWATNSSYNWRFDYNGTGSNGTGPAGGLLGGTGATTGTQTTLNRYMYCETSGSGADRVGVVRTPALDFTNALNNNTLKLTFWFHMYGTNNNNTQYFGVAATTNTNDASSTYEVVTGAGFTSDSGGGLNIEYWTSDDGTTTTTSNRISGQQQSSDDSVWRKAEVDLNSLAGQGTVYLHFMLSNIEYFTCDFALDGISIIGEE